MKWRGREQSSNVNRRGRGSSGRSGGPMIPLGGGGLILILILSLLFGQNPLDLINGTQQNSGPESGIQSQQATNPGERSTGEAGEIEDFLATVLADTERVWNDIFDSYGRNYNEPVLNFYKDSVQTGCGLAGSNLGPFYCPNDEGIYIDISFSEELKNNFDAPGDFALAYVLAHEVGHHVQNELGITEQVFTQRERLSETEFNKLSVKMELQADYYAGVFAKYVEEEGYLEAGDIKEAMNAAAGVGDDRIQEKAIGRVIPDKFTHGTSEQRVNWFMRGYEYGDLEHGNTFEEVN